MNRVVLSLLGCLAIGGIGHSVGAAQESPTEDHAAAGAQAAPADAHGDTLGDSAQTDGHGAAPSQTGHDAAHDAGHPPHDPLDLSHGNGSAQLRAAQELRFDLAIATFLVFLLLLGILTKFAWGPILAGLARREDTIANQIAEARLAAETAGKQLAEYERRLAAATEEARAIVAQSKNDALTVKDRIVAEAQEAAQKERERAVADIGTAKNEALREIAAQSVQTAVQLASNIVRRELKPEDHDRLIGESLQQFSKLN
jgi:F-type H+-transporting ATPase subunit b